MPRRRVWLTRATPSSCLRRVTGSAADSKRPYIWAGTETAIEHAGYVEGALESGDRAAAEVLALAGSSTNRVGTAIAARSAGRQEAPSSS